MVNCIQGSKKYHKDPSWTNSYGYWTTSCLISPQRDLLEQQIAGILLNVGSAWPRLLLQGRLYSHVGKWTGKKTNEERMGIGVHFEYVLYTEAAGVTTRPTQTDILAKEG